MAFLVSCGGGKDAVEATDAQETATASTESATYVVDTNVSSTTWKGFKIYESDNKEAGHYGAVQLKSGEVSVKDTLLESGKFVADMGSFHSVDMDESPEDKAKFEGHMMSPDFLDVTKFPEASFEITGAKKLDSGDYNTEVSGNLDFRGVPKNVTFKANVKEDGDKITIKSEDFKINRQDFGITFKGAPGSVIKDDVLLQLDVTATKK